MANNRQEIVEILENYYQSLRQFSEALGIPLDKETVNRYDELCKLGIDSICAYRVVKEMKEMEDQTDKERKLEGLPNTKT